MARLKPALQPLEKRNATHPGFLVSHHLFLCVLRCLGLRPEGANHQHAADPFLEKDPKPSVRLLHMPVQRLELPAKQPGEQDHHAPAGEQNDRKLRRKHQDHGQGAEKLYSHSRKTGQNVHTAVRYHLGVAGEPIEPFAGVDRADPQVIPVQQGFHKPDLEDIFQRGFGTLCQPTEGRLKRDLEKNKNDQENQELPKAPAVMPHSGIHNLTQEQRINHAHSPVQCLQDCERQNIPFLPAGYGIEPAHSVISCHVFSSKNF